MTSRQRAPGDAADEDGTGGEWRGQTSLGAGSSETFPAFEEHKAEVSDPKFLLEVCPEPIDQLVERLLDTDYVERRREILERRAETEAELTRRIGRIESVYGEVINRTLDRRLDGDPPSFDVDDYWEQAEAVTAELESLQESLDDAYLTYAEEKYLTNVESDVNSAREYLRVKRAFDDHHAELSADVAEFDASFEPYRGGTRYMISSDQEELVERANVIYRRIKQVTEEELRIQILPEEDVEWLEERKALFAEFTRELPEYNAAFVGRHRDRYAHVFETSHGRLKPAQQRAIIRNDRRNLVDASAGTGKTLTLTHRVVYLLERGVSPHDIAAVTFSNDAAEEMEDRIVDRVDDVRRGSLQISTIHTFANGITRRYGSSDADVSPGEMQDRLAEDYYRAAVDGGRPDHEPDPDVFERFARHITRYVEVETDTDGTARSDEAIVEDLSEFVAKAQTFDLSPAEIRQRTPDADERVSAFGLAGAALVAAYRAVAEDVGGPIDYDAMLTDAVDVVEDNPRECGNRYDHLLVDEFQDVSETEMRLFDPLVEHGSETHLFCVGDDWQSIYGFRGSDVRIFTGFPDEYEDTTYTSLDVNFRCPPAIVEAGATLMANATVPQNGKEVTADSDVETSPVVHRLRLFEQFGVEYVADLIEESLDIDADGRLSAEQLRSEEVRDYGDVMVVSQNDRNSDFLGRLRAELRARDLPFRNPKYERDYLPEWYEERPDEPDAPPVVQLKSIYAAKGTEAPVVILAPATDGPTDGIPPEDRPNGLFEPVVANPADHLPEQRRLFYVALTRTEAEFHAVGADGRISRFVDELDDYFEERVPPLEGVCAGIDEPRTDRAPYTVSLECDHGTIELVDWAAPTAFTVGRRYRILEPEIERNEYGAEVRYSDSRVVSVEQGDG